MVPEEPVLGCGRKAVGEVAPWRNRVLKSVSKADLHRIMERMCWAADLT